MFRRAKAALLWGRMISRIRQGKYEEASVAADRYRLLGLNDALFLALDATIDVLNLRSSVAREKFIKAEDITEGASENERYITLYCRYYICVIDKQEDCDILRQQALSLKVSSRIRAVLPLPFNDLLQEH
jgi:hypothetical protein